MPDVTYELPDGTVRTIDVPSGQTIMDGSVSHNLPGIVAECGGTASCGTCHVYLDDDSAAHFEDPAAEELELLQLADEVRPNSRLSCQLFVPDDCARVRVTVVATNG